MTDLELAQILGFADCPRCVSALARLGPVERVKQEVIAQGIWGDVDRKKSRRHHHDIV
jgi:hypothetical protein